MRSIRSQPRLLAAVAALTVWLAALQSWASWLSATPLDAPIDAARQGQIEESIEIRLGDPHRLQIAFNARPSTSGTAELAAIVGAPRAPLPSVEAPPSVRVPVAWSLRRAGDGAVVARGEVDTDGAVGALRGVFHRAVDEFRVDPGHYVLRVQVLCDLPELAGVTTRVELRPVTTAGATWQGLLVFPGMLVNWLVVAPLTMLLLLLSVGRALSYPDPSVSAPFARSAG